MCVAWMIVNTQEMIAVIIIINISINASVEVLLKNDLFSTSYFGLDLEPVNKQS